MGLYTSLVSKFLFPVHEFLKRHNSVALRRQMEEVQWWSADHIAALQLRRLHGLLQDVAVNVPYYRDLFARLGFDASCVRSITDLQYLPFLTKTDIRASTDQLRHVQAKGLTRFNTGGSSGEPRPTVQRGSFPVPTWQMATRI